MCRLLRAIVSIVIAIGNTTGAVAQPMPAAYNKLHPVNVDASDVTVYDVLSRLFRGGNVVWRIGNAARSIAEHDRCTVHTSDVSLDRLLYGILEGCRPNRPRLTYRVENGVYVVDVPKISVHIVRSTLSDALRQVFTASDVDYVTWGIESANTPITTSLENKTVDIAVSQLLNTSGLSQRYVSIWRHGVNVIGPRPQPNRRYYSEPTNNNGAGMSIRFSAVNGADALDALFNAIRGSYLTAVHIDQPVTYSKTDYSFHGCLSEVLRLVDQDLTYTIESTQQSVLCDIVRRPDAVLQR